MLNGLEAARRISSSLAGIQLVMLTIHVDEFYLLSALKAGPRGYVLKSSAEAELVGAIRAVSQGKLYVSPKVSTALADEYVRYVQACQIEDRCDMLTRRERQLLRLLTEGRCNKDIADALDLSPASVICQGQHLFETLKLHSLADLILYEIRNGAIFPSNQEAMVCDK
jgi:two-component system, NarL family, response regulator NreC